MNESSVDAVPHPHSAGERLKMERLLLFADAVFAIIVTLLALELRLPDDAILNSSQAVLDALIQMQPQFGAYVLSFFVIALVWNVQLLRYRHIVAVNGKIVAGTILQLMCVGLLPFATSLMARHVNSLVVSLYAAIILINTLVGWATWLIAVRDPTLIGPDFTPRMRWEGNARSATVAGIFACSIAIAWWSPTIAMLSWALQIPFNRLISYLGRRRGSAQLVGTSKGVG